jgi:hypothetical protein
VAAGATVVYRTVLFAIVNPSKIQHYRRMIRGRSPPEAALDNALLDLEYGA